MVAGRAHGDTAQLIRDQRRQLEELRREVDRLRRDLERSEHERARLERERDGLARERDGLARERDRLRDELEAARRAAKRQAAPFSKGVPTPRPRRPGRQAGPAYGPRAWRPVPEHIDEVVEVLAPPACPTCGGAVEHAGVAMQQIVASVLRTCGQQQRDRLALLVALQRSPHPVVADLTLPGPAPRWPSARRSLRR